MWCVGEIDGEYRKRMYEILDLYNKPYNFSAPVIGFDEKSKQLIEEARPPLGGKIRKIDYEYKRAGVRNIFVAVEPLAGKRFVSVTARRTKEDFANFIRYLVDVIYVNAKIIHIVLDNLNTHFKKSFIETFGTEEAERILSKIIFHYTPKHASWLNVAEIEIGIMDRQCLDRRISSEDVMKKELELWQQQRNKDESKITWSFSKQKADEKLSKHYI